MKQRLFGSSGLRVSELCLGSMMFGTENPNGADKAESFKIMEVFANAGGTFIDTANKYTQGTSESWVGEFVHGDRDHFVVATKYSLADRVGDTNFAGNHRKNLVRSLDASLKRLGTDHIDLFWLHAWDFTTPVEEVMRSMEDVVLSGKVLYLGISDTPAWICSQANTLAELRGWRSFVGLQIEYSLLARTPERDLLPMAKAFGLGVTPWGVLGGGALSGKYLRGEKGRVPESSPRRSEHSRAITEVVVSVAEEIGCSALQVALAWVRHQGYSFIPIVGCRNATQITESIQAVTVTLSTEQLTKLHEVTKIELGFPHEFLKSDGVLEAFGGSLGMIERP